VGAIYAAEVKILNL